LIADEDERLRRIIRGTVGTRVKRSTEVDDLIQEVWLRVFSRLDGLKARDVAGLRSWLRRIARNCCHDALRRAGQRSELPGLELEPPLSGSGGRRQAHEHHESRTRVLTRLAPEERIVLWLRGTQSLSWETTRLILRKPSARVARGVYAHAKHRVPVLGSIY
jgi:RNA polymerase sigma-70 factor (ECF subfamily)